MPRPALGEKAMSNAERQRRHKERQAERIARMEAALTALLLAAERGTIGPKYVLQKARKGLEMPE